ncbi:MAG: metal ABC transporter substrate-binding protein [Clostridiales bacterium]|nr:metal ABC transporter substrate-binding protein [Clostridiales bacterium]
MKKALAALLVLLLFLPALAGAETVVTSFYPVWILARNLTEGIEGLEVVNMAANTTGCLHDYTLQNSDMAVLSAADALLINGSGMEAFLPVITSAYPDLPVVDATAGLPFLSESDLVEIGEPEEGEEINAHLWLDPQRAGGMAANLADGLIRLFPDKTRQITDNLDAFTARLLSLDETLREGLSGAKRKVIIFHEALPYFAQACGLPAAAVVNKEPEDTLPTAQLVRVVQLIRSEETMPLILKSAEEDPSVNTLVTETGVPVCELDPLTSGPDDPPLDYYETVMIQNMKSLQSAME